MALSPEQRTQLINEAWEYLDLDELDEAHLLIEQLLADHAEEGYELMSTYHAIQEDFEAAVEVLQQGVKQFPNAWRMRLELGQRLAQIGQGQEGLNQIAEAEQTEGADQQWVAYHKGQVLAALGQFDEALNTLQQINHPDLLNTAFAYQLGILYDLQRYDLIIELASEELEQLTVPQNEAEAEIMSQVVTYVGKAYMEELGNEDASRHYIRQAIEYDRTNIEAITALRELDSDYEEGSMVYHLNVQGIFQTDEVEESGEHRTIPFFTSYAIIATSVEEALEMAKAFEIDGVIKDSLSIEDQEVNENEDQEPSGVYMVSPLMFIDPEGADSLFDGLDFLNFDDFDLDDFDQSDN